MINITRTRIMFHVQENESIKGNRKYPSIIYITLFETGGLYSDKWGMRPPKTPVTVTIDVGSIKKGIILP
jgi:hypothetical protein